MENEPHSNFSLKEEKATCVNLEETEWWRSLFGKELTAGEEEILTSVNMGVQQSWAGSAVLLEEGAECGKCVKEAQPQDSTNQIFFSISLFIISLEPR
jgi:hypothetical protein